MLPPSSPARWRRRACCEVLADVAHARIGDRMAIMLGDGTRTRATVVAIYTRDLAFGDALLAPELAAGHETTSPLGTILIQTGQPAAAATRLQALAPRYPGLQVSDSALLVTATDADRELNHWLGPFFVAMLFAFTSIAVLNTPDHDRASAPPRARAPAAHRRHHAPGPVDGTLGSQPDHHHRPRHRTGDRGHRAAAAQPRAHGRLPSLHASLWLAAILGFSVLRPWWPCQYRHGGRYARSRPKQSGSRSRHEYPAISRTDRIREVPSGTVPAVPYLPRRGWPNLRRKLRQERRRQRHTNKRY